MLASYAFITWSVTEVLVFSFHCNGRCHQASRALAVLASGKRSAIANIVKRRRRVVRPAFAKETMYLDGQRTSMVITAQ